MSYKMPKCLNLHCYNTPEYNFKTKKFNDLCFECEKILKNTNNKKFCLGYQLKLNIDNTTLRKRKVYSFDVDYQDIKQ